MLPKTYTETQHNAEDLFVYAKSNGSFPLLATLTSHFAAAARCQGCKSARFLPPRVDNERWQQVKEIDGTSNVMGAGSPPVLTATFRLASVTIVFHPVFLAQPLIELAAR